ncbi:ATP-dependent helicase HrpB [Leptospira idonii]|uniref:ATP-dependent helicase HrpB n=1 Tax=Leptospira idonii TaxID=1193500 RepID=UPI0014382562|nr:ATP-dependent helicase HrpB [Leptospira idonii]
MSSFVKENYPIHSSLPEILSSLQNHSLTILEAPPGSGKTTVLPLEILNTELLGEKKILILEPRRMAARNAALRMSGSLGEEVGQKVGYRIRFETKISKNTRIEVITDGIFSKMLLDDPELKDYGLVLFDEFHERNLDSDFCFALCRRTQELFRQDLKLMIMSATLDGFSLPTQNQEHSQVKSEGKMFPVDIRYLGDSSKRLSERLADILPKVADQTEGNILVFLSGVGEILEAENLLFGERSKLSKEIKVLKLYGEMNFETQKEIFIRSPERRIILSTNIAESSVTIPNVRVVVDSGFCKRAVFDPGSGLTRLERKRISLASAKQRSGRAGREAPGISIRMWSEEEEKNFITSHPPEILEGDISKAVLMSKQWGEEIYDLPLVSKPSLGAIKETEKLLTLLGLLDEKNKITELGKYALKLPLHVRLAGMCLLMKGTNSEFSVSELATLISEKDILGSGSENPDFLLRWEKWKEKRSLPSSLVSKMEQSSRQLDLLLKDIPSIFDLSNKLSGFKIGIAGVLSLAYPDRIAKQRISGSGRYKLFNGKGGFLKEGVLNDYPEYIVILDSDGHPVDAKIYSYLAVSEKELLMLHSEKRTKRTVAVLEEKEKNQKVLQYFEEETWGEISIQKNRISSPSDSEKENAILNFWKSYGISRYLKENDSLKQLVHRMELLIQNGFALPSLEEDVLIAGLKEWLLPFYSFNSGKLDLFGIDFKEALLSRLNHSEREILNKEAPSLLIVPSGSSIPISYEDSGPVLAVKLQEVFGMKEVPKIAGKNVAITLHLLSPAKRPVQVTKDLKNFWDSTYHEVKKELKGRYPKHPWPDSPWEAVASKGTKKQQLK